MQGGQGTLASVMEAAANVAASAKSGLDKTKAVVEEKVPFLISIIYIFMFCSTGNYKSINWRISLFMLIELIGIL